MQSVGAQVLVEDLEQDPSPADEPPVDVLDLAVLGVVLALQGIDLSQRDGEVELRVARDDFLDPGLEGNPGSPSELVS